MNDKEMVLESITIEEEIRVYNKRLPEILEAKYAREAASGLPRPESGKFNCGNMTFEEFGQKYPMHEIGNKDVTYKDYKISRTYRVIK